MSKSKKSVDKWFMENYENINEDEAMELIVQAEQRIKEIQEERAADEKLANAKQIVKDLNSAYADAIKHERSKISFFLEKLAGIKEGKVNPTGNS